MSETFTQDDLIQELSEYYPSTPTRQQGQGITIPEYIGIVFQEEGKNISEKVAGNRLNNMCREKGWTKQKMYDYDGIIRTIWYKE
jgi:hypothetical protein